LINLGFQRISVVSEGLNFKSLAEIPEKEDTPVIVYVGRLKRAKRPDHAIKALAVVKQEVRRQSYGFWVVVHSERVGKTCWEGVRFFGHLGNEERRGLIGRSWF